MKYLPATIVQVYSFCYENKIRAGLNLNLTTLAPMSEPAVQTLPPQYIVKDCFLVKMQFPGIQTSHVMQFPLPHCVEIMQAVRYFNKTKSPRVARFLLTNIQKQAMILGKEPSAAAGQSMFVIDMDELYHITQQQHFT